MSLSDRLGRIWTFFRKNPAPTPDDPTPDDLTPDDPTPEVEPIYPKEILDIAADYGYAPATVAEVRGLPLDELEKLAEAFLVEQKYRGPLCLRLQPAKDLLAPFLISVLNRPDAFTPLPKLSSYSVYESRGQQALSLLKHGVHPEVKKSLLRVMMTNDRYILQSIASHLVSFGSDDLLPAVETLFEHDHMFVSGDARLGALQAIRDGRAENGFREYVWHHCVKLLRSAKPPHDYGSHPIALGTRQGSH